MLVAHELQVRLNRQPVLHGVTLAARPGALTAIVGPNGSGKTTLLRALTGELRGTGEKGGGGEVTLDGVPLARMGAQALALRRAVLPQSTRLAFAFTLREVVALGLAAGPMAGQGQIIDLALRAVDLEPRAGARFPELSGGEQARGHLARALAQAWEPLRDGRANWLLLDEPVASLDIGHQLLVMRLAADYAARGGGVVAVMHDLNLTAMFADHVVLLDQGGVLAEGPPAAVLTDALLARAYRAPLRVGRVPGPGALFILPQSATI